ncbi:MAG: tRNA pseudouridine(13) synthase TruD [Thalassotalea sp.]
MSEITEQTLPYLHGKPTAQGDLRTQMSDFKVFELLPFQISGEGEHVVLHVRKTGLNTIFVANQLAKCFGVKEAHVSYAGLKDRFAVCEQYFSVHLPGKAEVDASTIKIDGVEVLSISRHNKKIRIGSLLGNRFELTLRNINNPETLSAQWQKITELGVPNYFGEQRFGIEQGNLTRALELFAGKKVKDKKKRGMYLSAARSLLFNQTVAKRIQAEQFNTLFAGDVCMLAGSQSVFLAEAVDDALTQRLHEFDIDLTAPMWGRGQLMSSNEVQFNEQAIADQYADFSQGLESLGLKQERRKIRLTLQAPTFNLTGDVLNVSFCLPSGCYATTILRELIEYQDIHELQRLEKYKESSGG